MLDPATPSPTPPVEETKTTELSPEFLRMWNSFWRNDRGCVKASSENPKAVEDAMETASLGGSSSSSSSTPPSTQDSTRSPSPTGSLSSASDVSLPHSHDSKSDASASSDSESIVSSICSFSSMCLGSEEATLPGGLWFYMCDNDQCREETEEDGPIQDMIADAINLAREERWKSLPIDLTVFIYFVAYSRNDKADTSDNLNKLECSGHVRTVLDNKENVTQFVVWNTLPARILAFDL